MKDVFSSCYVLPSLFHTDLDRGFSVIDYSLNKMLASREALDKLEGLGIDLKLDFILNHASVLSKQFQDIIKMVINQNTVISSSTGISSGKAAGR